MREVLGYQYCLGCDLLPTSDLNQFRSWLKSCDTIDVFKFGRFLANLDVHTKAYLSRYEHSPESRVTDIQSFKRSASDCKGYWGFISPIYPILEKFLQQPETREFRVITQWINFIRRVNLRDLDLSDSMQQEYLAFEQDILSWSYDEMILNSLNSIIQSWFGSHYDLMGFRPKHGPGSVASFKGRLPLIAKYSVMNSDLRLEYLSKYIGSVQSYCPFPLTGNLDRTSELVCVPKSMITNRTISKEPTSLQYFQQGAMDLIMNFVSDHNYLNRRISFRDQSKSAELARLGSIFGDYATIDLSSASDSVTLYMVKRVFRGTWVLPLLITTRSDNTKLFDGQVIKLNKFAPMGSAVCFPIETIVFAACCEHVRRTGGGRADYRVFGDDIVIQEAAVEQLLHVLAACHFKVNVTKSFWGTTLLNFREACGGEYFNGEEVTPLRVSRGFKSTTRFTAQSADHISAYISFANQAFDAGYLQLRREILLHLKNHMPKWLFDSLIFSVDGSRGIKTFEDCCTNYKLESRTNANLQLKEVHGNVPKSISRFTSCEECLQSLAFCHRTKEQCEYIRYYEWLRRTDYQSEEPRVVDGSLQICPARSVMSRAWVATELL
jgi:hypothetical protein